MIAHPTLECERGACAAGHPEVAAIGARMFELGGNAVDAATAACFAAFVLEQLDATLGGFARISVYCPVAGRSISYDGYVRAPAAARPDMFEADGSAMTYYGHPPTVGDRARHGVLAPATPGAVAALCAAHGDRGQLPLAQVIEPAIEAARAGAPLAERDRAAIARLAAPIAALPETAMALGDDRLDGEALARTLAAIAAGGPAAFYTGPIAAAIAGFLEARGGILSAADLAAVRAPSIEEEPARYAGARFTTGLDRIGYEALQILDALGPPCGELEARHLMAEALAAAFTDVLAHEGDPAFVASPIAGLRSRGFAGRRAAGIDRGRAMPRPVAPADPWPFDPAEAGRLAPGAQTPRDGTTQIVAADRDGLMVSITTAVGWDYGSLVYVPETGVFLNNAMSYFDPRPGRPNSIAGGKAPIFGAPTLVAWSDRGARLACAGSGGYRIQTAVLHATTAILGGADPAAALDRPRVHCQGRETVVSERIDGAVIAGLAAAGHAVERSADRALEFGRCAAIARDPETQRLLASASPAALTGVAGR